ncbi:MAG: hypothetical protein KAI85_00940, partial [Halopseudomonas aestusnigri]|nr:hypothetical protein [Halopseudomonas aestusnigri]
EFQQAASGAFTRRVRRGSKRRDKPFTGRPPETSWLGLPLAATLNFRLRSQSYFAVIHSAVFIWGVRT